MRGGNLLALGELGAAAGTSVERPALGVVVQIGHAAAWQLSNV